MKSTVTITVKISPGSSIEDAFKDATGIANKLGCYVDFKFNDVLCIAKCGGDPEKGVDSFTEETQNEKQYKIAIN